LIGCAAPRACQESKSNVNGDDDVGLCADIVITVFDSFMAAVREPRNPRAVQIWHGAVEDTQWQ
jgi:hypothetical protein